MKRMPLACYASLGLPLAMAMLPIYVLVPSFYAAELGRIEAGHQHIDRQHRHGQGQAEAGVAGQRHAFH